MNEYIKKKFATAKVHISSVTAKKIRPNRPVYTIRAGQCCIRATNSLGVTPNCPWKHLVK